MGFLKRVKAYMAKKAGVSITGRIHDFNVGPKEFKLYQAGKKVVILTNRKGLFGLGDIVRIREIGSGQAPRETHFYIEDIIEHSNSLQPGHIVLTLG